MKQPPYDAGATGHKINRIFLLGERRDGNYKHLADVGLNREVIITINTVDFLNPHTQRDAIHQMAGATARFHENTYRTFYVRTQFVTHGGIVLGVGGDEVLEMPRVNQEVAAA